MQTTQTAFPGLGRPFDEMKRISRILELTHMIAVRPNRYLRRDLASRFEISERTIQKDLDIIRNGMKLSLMHSRDGYFFEEMPILPALQYTFSEALALLLAVRTAQQISGIGTGELAAAVARLEALFPSEFGSLLKQAVHQPATSVPREHRQQMLALLHAALAGNRKVRMTYKTSSRDGALSERVVRPYHIQLHVRSWHLIAYCELRNEVRMFKVDRIEEAALTDKSYSIPEAFNVEEYIGNAWGIVRGTEAKTEEVTLHFDDEAGRWVSEEFWHHSQSVELHPDGGVLFRVQIPVTPEFVHWVLYYGARVEVLEPGWLRDRVAEEHGKAAKIYQ